MSKVNSENLYASLPETPGVYLMKDSKNRILYIGKAVNLRRRVSSYFTRPHDYKIEKLVNSIQKIDFKKTDTAIEALILESQLIKKYKPPFNVKEKDDKSFLWVMVTKDKFPRILLARGKGLPAGRQGIFGPFTSATSIREALRILRKIFPWSVHSPEQIDKVYASLSDNKPERLYPEPRRRACFDCEIGLCPGTCVGLADKKEYLKNIKNVKLFLEGKKQKIVKFLEKEMEVESKKLDFEKAIKIRRQIFALKHIRDIALISDTETYDLKPKAGNYRIEGYDISNISGTSATGSMVVFVDGKPDRNEYRKFRIKTITQSNDVGMIKEVLRRRLRKTPLAGGWPLPNLILVDGGVGQVNAVKEILSEAGLGIPVLGIAKGAARKKNEFIGKIPEGADEKVLIKVRNEAHRFAISYHKALRSRKFFE